MQILLSGLFLVFSLIVHPQALVRPQMQVQETTPQVQEATPPAQEPAGDVAVEAASAFVLKISLSSNRANPVDLNGQTVSGNIYVFASPDTGATQVRFYLDNPAASGAPVQTEGNPPWDFAGGNSTVANPYDTKKLSNGSHSITVSVTLTSGAIEVTTATFTVNNASATSVAPTATPVPPPTSQPTATSQSSATSQPTATATMLPPTVTSQPTATATKQPTATPPTSYNNLFSKSSNRSSAIALNAQTVSGDIYVFVSPESGATQVSFFLDNPSASGTPHRTEGNPPWDFNGGDATTATAYDTRKLSNGSHSITASITLSSGAKTLTTANFTVNNSTATSTPVPTATAARTATPAPTATRAPTATPGSMSGYIYWGVAMDGLPTYMTKLSTWERDVTGKGASIVHWGHNWANGTGYRSWSNTAANNTRGHGSIPMLSWNPDGGDDTRYQLSDIIGGAHDSYIRQFATSVKTWGYPLFIRMMHEMNGSWGYPWQEDQNGNQRGEFVQAWRHIVDIFRSVGANNVSYVWCPNIDFAGSPRPTYASLYPGDSYVDWTCLDGYNWGTNRQEGWQTFDQVFNWSYNEIVKVAPSKPVMLGEFGSVEQGGSKANWFTDTLSAQLPSRYPKMRAIVYFNWQMSGVDWRIETTSSASSAWRSGIASKYYAANSFGSITGKVAVP